SSGRRRAIRRCCSRRTTSPRGVGMPPSHGSTPLTLPRGDAHHHGRDDVEGRAAPSSFGRCTATTRRIGQGDKACEHVSPGQHLRRCRGGGPRNVARNRYVRVAGLACGSLLLFLPALALPAQTENVVILAAAEQRPYIGPDLPRQGYAAELVRAALKKTGYTLELRFYPAARAR